jgi:hypothetical protein
MIWQQVKMVSQAHAGWFMPFVFPNGVLGIVFDRSYLSNAPIVVRLILTIPLLILLLWGLVKAYGDKRQTFIAAGACLATIFAGYLLLAFMGRTDLGLGGYKSFKLLSFFLPLVVCSWMLWMQGQVREDRITRRIRRIVVCIIAPLVIGSGIAASVKAARRSRVVTPEIAALRAIEKMPQINSINIHSMECWDILWQAYFLMGKKLYFAYSSYAGREATPLQGDWDLWNKSDFLKGGLRISPSAVAFQNNRYVLIRHNNTKRNK